MSNRYACSSEPNLMMYSFSRDSAVYRFMEIARNAVVTGKLHGLDKRLVAMAKEEFREFLRGLDMMTPYFSGEFADMVLGSDTRRRILVVQGKFEGDYDIRSTIGYDLGTEPYRLYKRGERPRGQTLDDYLTREAVNAYLREHAIALRSRGVERFRVRHSAFFSFRDADLRSPARSPDGSINMKKLLPLVADTILNNDQRTGYIGIEEVTLPTPEEYAAHVIPFTSSRIKATLGRKLIRQLLLPQIKPDEPITDTGAHRGVVDSLAVVRDLEKRIRDGKIGRSDFVIIPEKTKDKYKRPGKNGYKALKLVGYATTRGYTSPREVQLVGEEQYYGDEINPNDPAHHRQQEKKEGTSEREIRRIPEPIRTALREIFGKSTLSITLEEALDAR